MERMIALLKLMDCLGEVEGRKKLQKIVHILQSRGHREFSHDFGYLHYGPFSMELSSDIDRLTSRTEHLIDEESPSEEKRPYRYRSTDRAREVLQSLGRSDASRWEPLAKKLNDQSPQLLEAVSTILFLQLRGFDDDRLESRFRDLKPELSGKGYLKKAKRFIESELGK